MTTFQTTDLLLQQAQHRRSRLSTNPGPEDINDAFVSLDWIVLGYACWAEYCRDVLETRPSLDPDVIRRGVLNLDAWRDEDMVGLSVRQMALSANVARSRLERILAGGEPVVEKPKTAPKYPPETPETRAKARAYRETHEVNTRELHRQFRDQGLKVATAEAICREVRARQGRPAGGSKIKSPAVPRRLAVAPEPKRAEIPIYARSEAVHAIRTLLAESKRGGYTNLIATDIAAAIDADDQTWLANQHRLVRSLVEYAARLDRLFDDADLRERLCRNMEEREDMGTLQPLELRVVSA